MISIADVLLVILYAVGHGELMVAVTVRGLFRLEDRHAKVLLVAGHSVLWCVVLVGSVHWIGLASFAEGFAGRSPWPQSLLLPWQWLASAVGLWRLVMAARWRVQRRAAGRPAQTRSRIRLIDYTAIRSRKARLIARLGLDRVETIEIDLELPRLPAAFDGLCIAHFSDLQYRAEVSDALFAIAIAEVSQASPDLIVITGDIVHAAADIDPVVALVASVSAPLGTYAVFGNHDSWSGPVRLEATLDAHDITVLHNQGQRLERNSATVWLAGVDDFWSPAADLVATLAGRADGEFCILLAHNPDQVMAVSREDVDLQLSGHTHGGQVVLPILGPIMVPSDHGLRFDAGLFKVGDTQLYVSRGLSAHPPLRVGSLPEITLLRLSRNR